jgi:hypothetical protein
VRRFPLERPRASAAPRLLADAPLPAALRRAIDTGEASAEAAPFVPRSAFCSRAIFEAGGWEACSAGWEAAKR